MRKFLQWTGVAGAFVVGGTLTLLALCNALLQAPPVRRHILRKAAGSDPSATATVGGLLFFPPAGCIVRELSVQTAADPDGTEILSVPWARIRPDWNALAHGRIVASEIVLERPHAAALIENGFLHLPLFGVVSLTAPSASPLPATEPPAEQIAATPSGPSELAPSSGPAATPLPPGEGAVQTSQSTPGAPISRTPPPKRNRRLRTPALRVRNARFSLLAPAAGLPPLCEIEGIEAGQPAHFLALSKSAGGQLDHPLAIRSIRVLGRTVAHGLSSPVRWSPEFRLLLPELHGSALDGELLGQAVVGLFEPGIPFAATASVKGASLRAAAELPSELGLNTARSEAAFHLTGLARKPDSLSGQALVRIIESPPSNLPGGAALRGRLRARLLAGKVIVDDAYFSSPEAEFRALGFAGLTGKVRFSVRCFVGPHGQEILAAARSNGSAPLPPIAFGSLEGRDDAYLDFHIAGTYPKLQTDLLGSTLPLDETLTQLRSIRASQGSASRHSTERGVSPPEP